MNGVADRSERFEAACELVLASVCAVLEREGPPPPGWHGTEYMSLDGLQVHQVQPGGGVAKEHEGLWVVGAGPTPREKVYFPTAEAAMLAAGVLARLKSESRA